MTSQRGSLTFVKKVEIFAEFQKGKSSEELTSTFSENRSVIQSVLNQQPRLEKVELRGLSAFDCR